MAKKQRLNAKQKEQARLAEKSKWQAVSKEKQLEQERIAAEEEAKANARKLEQEKLAREAEFKQFFDNTEFAKEKTVKKSSAKAAGLKSAFTLGNNEVLITSFGRGNEAIIEKKISADGEILSLAEKAAFELKESEQKKSLSIIGRTTGTVDNPQYKPDKTVRENATRTKAALERKYFGQTFDDNIHIQLIQCILDIKKILAGHCNNIVYTLNNIRRDYSANSDPIGIGTFSLNQSYEDFSKSKYYYILEDFVNLDNLSYFGDTFYRKPTREEVSTLKAAGKNIPKTVRRSEEDIYYLLCLINEFRQVCVHSPEFGDVAKSEHRHSNIYNFESNLNEKQKDMLDTLYNEKLRELTSFAKNASENNFTVIFDLLKADTNAKKWTTAQNYYNFAIRKNYKNNGFSLKTLRESMIASCCKHLGDDAYSSVRSKLYGILDFVIWDYYNSDETKVLDLVGKLRTTSKNEDKAHIYFDEANAVYSFISDKVSLLLEYCKKIMSNKESFPLSDEDKQLVKDAIQDIALSSKVSYFSKFIYLITMFVDGKEINDLLTNLINKLDNIAAFETVLKSQFGEVVFAEQFSFFNSENFLNEKGKSPYVDELVEINSFARMSRIEVFKKSAYKEAAYLLGTKLTDEEIDEYVESNFIDKQKLPKIKNKKGQLVTDAGKRNFLINNVLKSRRFNYLVRYADPYKIRECIKNEAIVKFVLKGMDDKIIDRYYKSCISQTPADRETKLGALVDLLSKQMSIDFATDVNQKARENDPNKQAKRAAVSLYLNILYQVAKNLVYVNARYVMAFHALERDLCLHGIDRDNYTALTQKAIDGEWLNKRATIYLTTNMSNCDEWAIRNFRNKVAHLNAVRKIDQNIKGITRVESYFELYHYVMQHELASQYHYRENLAQTDDRARSEIATVSQKTKDYISLAESNSWYVKDFVKALNIPFGYNLPRYKNLSIDILFDRNETREMKGFALED